MNKFKKYCIILSAVVIMFSTLTNVYAFSNYNKALNQSKEYEDEQNLKNEKIHSEVDEIEKLTVKTNNDYITNILLIGNDASAKNQKGRSDSMMILTIDEKNKALKLVSLARDTLVNIPGYGYEKLAHAYAYGGPKLLLDTIESNFKVQVKDYISVNFNSFIDLVDVLGGVEVDINEKEISYLNDVIVNSFKISNKENEEPQYIRMPGKQLLNGYQTLAYARIRKLDTIYNRDQRQRNILNNIAIKLSEAPISSYPNLINSVASHVDVNMSVSKILKLAVKSRELYNYDIKQLEFPLRQHREEGQIEATSAFIVKWDKVENIKELQNFIYEK